MPNPLRLMCVLAHPDDETFGTGGLLLHSAAQGVETSLICATRGERGWHGSPETHPGLEALGRIREAELRAAVHLLGLREAHFLDYVDGDLDQADPAEAAGRIARRLRQVRPQVVVTMSPDGYYGHPDHIAISQFTQAAVTIAADPTYPGLEALPPHRVSKLYYSVDSQKLVEFIHARFGVVYNMPVDGVERQHVGWAEWAITTRLDVRAHWRRVVAAGRCHQSQHADYGPLLDQPNEVQEQLWGTANLYRVFSLVNGGRQVEHDLFEGLR